MDGEPEMKEYTATVTVSIVLRFNVIAKSEADAEFVAKEQSRQYWDGEEDVLEDYDIADVSIEDGSDE